LVEPAVWRSREALGKLKVFSQVRFVGYPVLEHTHRGQDEDYPFTVFQLRGFERMRSVAIKAIAYNEIGVSFTSVRTPADGSKLHASLHFFF
jgi:hypothetical protein